MVEPIEPTRSAKWALSHPIRYRIWELLREGDARHRFVTREISDEWREGAFIGNWYVELTPQEADELSRRLFLIVDELRRRATPTAGATQTFVSTSVLPLLE